MIELALNKEKSNNKVIILENGREFPKIQLRISAKSAYEFTVLAIAIEKENLEFKTTSKDFYGNLTQEGLDELIGSITELNDKIYYSGLIPQE